MRHLSPRTLLVRKALFIISSTLILEPTHAANDVAVPDNAVVVSVSAENDNCVVALAGEQIATDKFADRLAEIKDKTRTVIISADESVPYKCIGRAIYMAQKAGFLTIGYMSRDTADGVAEPEKTEADEREAGCIQNGAIDLL